jgi:hypothetical protein
MAMCQKKDIYKRNGIIKLNFFFYVTTDTSTQNILLNITDISHKISYKCYMKVVKVCTIIFVDIYLINNIMCGAIC